MNKNNNSSALDALGVSDRKGVVEPIINHMDLVREDILLGIQKIEDLVSVIARHLKREHDTKGNTNTDAD